MREDIYAVLIRGLVARRLFRRPGHRWDDIL
jgi:hypothetical protein